MNKSSNTLKALALLSGGLDSTLAIKVSQKCALVALEIEALHFSTIFCRCDGKNGACGSAARTAAENLNVSVHNINNTNSLIDAVRNPLYGYGSNVNPCIDCRINMLHSTREFMEKSGASFIITGEVLGQRPMSQHLRALMLIERETRLQGHILRPLSAGLLEPTVPEKNRWIDRGKLLAISGRSRKPQMSLANIFEIKDYPCPAGGCLLTDPAFALKMKDLLKYDPDFVINDVLLLQIGRHFRINENLKLVVGRNEIENQSISNLVRPGDLLVETADYVGPVALLRGEFNSDDIRLAGSIVGRYADINKSKQVNLKLSPGNTLVSDVRVMPDLDIEPYRINKTNG